MTYVILSVVVLAILALVTYPTLRGLPFRPLALTALSLVALTAVFDNVIVGLDIVAYDESKISGLLVPIAPIEDFAYALGAVLLVPALWAWMGSGRGIGRIAEADGKGADGMGAGEEPS